MAILNNPRHERFAQDGMDDGQERIAFEVERAWSFNPDTGTWFSSDGRTITAKELAELGLTPSEWALEKRRARSD